MIVGIGVDAVDIERFTSALERTPGLASRLFTLGERGLPPASLAARFAAKEALIKAFGESGNMGWHDVSVIKDEAGKPSFVLAGEALKMAEAKGIINVQLSLSHDGGMAVAFVVAEGA